MKIEKILLDKDNRMLRIGFGRNKGKGFFRIDLWKVGYRFKKSEPKTTINLEDSSQPWNWKK